MNATQRLRHDDAGMVGKIIVIWLVMVAILGVVALYLVVARRSERGGAVGTGGPGWQRQVGGTAGAKGLFCRTPAQQAAACQQQVEES